MNLVLSEVMDKQLIQINATEWKIKQSQSEWIRALEDGKVLYFPSLPFSVEPDEKQLFVTEIHDPNHRNISLDAKGILKGATGSQANLIRLAEMMKRFRENAQILIQSFAPQYQENLRVAPTSYRPLKITARQRSWRADDQRLHVDAFPSRPNYGERILRVFINLNPYGEPRVWRIGEPFEEVAKKFLDKAKPYSRFQAKILNVLKITKSFRSEYDHLMLQFHDGMKADVAYQKNCPQFVLPFPVGAVWVCFSDQVPHAVMSGQYMMEQTFHLPVASQYNPDSSPLSILQTMTKRHLIA